MRRDPRPRDRLDRAGRTARRFSRADRITILFCGSNKSLASGLPIATVLFSGGDVALIVLPLMLYHQLQIIAGAAARLATPQDGGGGG